MSKYDAVYFVGDNQAINRVRVDSSKTRNRGAFLDLLAALQITYCFYEMPSRSDLVKKVGTHTLLDLYFTVSRHNRLRYTF